MLKFRPVFEDQCWSIGADPGIQVRGTHLIKLRQAEGGAKMLVWKIKILAKNHIFSNFRVGAGAGCALGLLSVYVKKNYHRVLAKIVTH
jgi:hypothetical protein